MAAQEEAISIHSPPSTRVAGMRAWLHLADKSGEVSKDETFSRQPVSLLSGMGERDY